MTMDFNTYNPGLDSNDPQVERKGSVKRARQMLEAGRRPEVAMPLPQSAYPGPPPRFMPNPPRMTQWPLPADDGLHQSVSGHQVRRLVPKGPLPERPPRPVAPSPSIYSERSISDIAPSPLRVPRPIPSPAPCPAFMGPLPPRPDSAVDSTPRVSVATEDPFRQSTASSVVSTPSISDFFVPALSAEHDSAQRPSQRPSGPSNAARYHAKRRSSVSPIPEELTDSPTIGKGSYASSWVIPSSWGSASPRTEILGAYLDDESDDDREPASTTPEGDPMLVRQASLGKRGKPSLRTIQKPNSPSPVQTQKGNPRAATNEIAVGPRVPRHSVSSNSTDSSEFDLKKPPIALGQHPAFRNAGDDMDALQNELGILSTAAPTMSDKRPGGRRPPRLDIGAVRAAEARGSLTSLPDLIRRATKLASNLEHGRTASRNNMFGGGDGRLPTNPSSRAGTQSHKSGSIRDILASFPPPAGTPEVRSSWPDFFRKAPMHPIRSNETGPEVDGRKGRSRPRRYCGMSPLLFMLVCLLVIAIILVAILVPVFLVAAPHRKSSSNNNLSTCERTAPCANGGVSVSSGSICSCVCANGFTGSRCTVTGDASCVTTEISQGSTSKNATMGSDLPRLFEESRRNFSIPVDPLTIMALFSQNNVSCTTENALVSFKGIPTTNHARRHRAPIVTPAPTLDAREAVDTKNGIVFDDSFTSQSAAAAAAPTSTTEQQTTATIISNRTLDFSRIAVLYIFEKTGALNAAMQSEEDIKTYLTHSYPSRTGRYDLDLSASGILGNFTLDFDEFSITMPNGTTVGSGH